MDILILVMVGITCAYATASILNGKERTKVFNKKKLEVTDVKAYNKACAILVIGFGVVAEILLFFGFALGEVTSAVAPLALVIEAMVVLKIYERIEKKYKK